MADHCPHVGESVWCVSDLYANGRLFDRCTVERFRVVSVGRDIFCVASVTWMTRIVFYPRNRVFFSEVEATAFARAREPLLKGKVMPLE